MEMAGQLLAPCKERCLQELVLLPTARGNTLRETLALLALAVCAVGALCTPAFAQTIRVNAPVQIRQFSTCSWDDVVIGDTRAEKPRYLRRLSDRWNARQERAKRWPAHRDDAADRRCAITPSRYKEHHFHDA